MTLTVLLYLYNLLLAAPPVSTFKTPDSPPPDYSLAEITLPSITTLIRPTPLPSKVPMQCEPGATVITKRMARHTIYRCEKDGVYAGESRVFQKGSPVAYKRIYHSQKGVEAQIWFDNRQGFLKEAATFFDGKIFQNLEWKGPHLFINKRLNRAGDGLGWSYEWPGKPASGLTTFKNFRRHGLQILWSPDGSIDTVKQFRDGRIFGRWIFYSDSGEVALRASCVKLTDVGPEEPLLPEYAWKMPEDFALPDGQHWVSLANAQKAMTKPCVIDGITIPPITELPQRAPAVPPQPQIPELTWRLRIAIPEGVNYPEPTLHVLIYDVLVDVPRWRAAVLEAFITPSQGQWIDKVQHNMETEAPDFFLKLWLKEKHEEPTLSRKHQIALAKRILSWVPKAERKRIYKTHKL